MLESERDFRILFEFSPIGISIIDKKRNVVEANRELQRLVGIAIEDLKNGLFRKRRYIHPDGSEFLPEDFPSSIAIREKKTVKEVEIGIIKEDGVTIWVEVTASPMESDPGLAVVITKDITEKKQYEEKLKSSEKELKSLFENSLLGISQTLPDGSLLRINKAFSDIFGYESPDEMLKEVNVVRNNIYQRPDDRIRIIDMLNKDGILEPTLFEMNHKSGSKIYIMIGAKKILDEDGNLLYIQAEHLDMTKRKLAESGLAEREASFRSIFENAIMGISQVYPGGGLIRINQAYAEMYGYPDTSTMEKETKGTTAKLFAYPSDREKVLAILDKNGSMPPTEFELKRRDGSNFWALVSAKQVRDDSGKLLYLQAEHIDITSLKNAQEALKEIGERHSLIMENSGLGIAYYTVDGKILLLNNVATTNLGGESSDYIGKNLTEIFGNEAGKVYIERLKSAALSEDPIIFEDYVEMQGIPGWYLSTHKRILNQNGEVDGIQVIADNITELKIAENKLKESQKKFRNLSRHLEDILEKERSEIALNLHDDLGQKLTALDLDLAWIRGRLGVQSTPVRKKLQEMHVVINEIITSMQELSSILKPAILTDLGLVPALISLLEKFEKQSGILCHFYRSSEYPVINNRISLVIYRVVQEAITNIARHAGATAVEIGMEHSGSLIEVKIKDNGKGISREQLNSSASIGISGIKERVRSVSGKVRFKGVKDSGTTIKVSIPLIHFNHD